MDTEDFGITATVNGEELTPRQRDILGIVVREYIDTAQPVGSATIVAKYGLTVSSATVRNELAYLEEHGYLTHPHTSAGRVPTERGYRYFVTQLMERADLPLDEQRMIRHQFHQVPMDLDQWMRLTAAVLAHTTNAAALVTAPYAQQVRFRHLKAILVSDVLGLVVLVLHGGTFCQEMIALSEPTTQEDMERAANRLNALFQGMSAAEIEASAHPLSELERRILESALGMMEQEARGRGVTLYRDGLHHLLQQPEFEEAARARHLLHIMEESTLLEQVLTTASQRHGVQVIIGGEGHWEDMGDYSIVLSRYGVTGHAAGALGVLGPLRMPYRRTVSVVRYVSRLLSELIGALFEE